MKIRLLLSYKGSRFYGWQKQKAKRTAQGEIEQALYKLFRKKISVIGSGRTDTGVHALGQCAHFELEDQLLKNISLKKALNHLFPEDIALLECWKAPEDFHARFSAKKKSYLYYIWTGESPPVLFSDLVWHRPPAPPMEKLQKISKLIIGEKDFKSFQSSGSSVQHTVRRIEKARWRRLSSSLYSFEITGSGFLKQMARNLVGASIEFLKEKNPEKKMKSLIAQRDRRACPPPAPGRGLYLKEVFYPRSLDRNSVKL